LGADVNTSIEALEDATIACIRANTPLFFGSEVGRSSHTPSGIMDSNLYPIEAAYGFKLNMTKAERLQSGESTVTHAMVITAVHLDDQGRAVRYKVENSWSKDKGEDGFFVMTAEWFREDVLQVVIPRSLAEEHHLEVLDAGQATVLPPWGPTGTFL
jgi:bleomycin hydrolase